MNTRPMMDPPSRLRSVLDWALLPAYLVVAAAVSAFVSIRVWSWKRPRQSSRAAGFIARRRRSKSFVELGLDPAVIEPLRRRVYLRRPLATRT